MQSSQIHKIIDRLRKLMRLQESAAAIGSIAEAQAAAARIAELSAKYHLKIADLPEEEIAATVIEAEWRAEKGSRKREAWMTRLAEVIAFGHSCQSLSAAGTSIYWFVGLEQDVIICKTMMTVMFRAGVQLYARERQSRPLDRRAYLLGFSNAIGYQYYISAKTAQETPSATALVKLIDRVIDQYLEAKKIRQAKPFKEADRTRADYHLGFKAGMAQDVDRRFLGESDEERRMIGACQNKTSRPVSGLSIPS